VQCDGGPATRRCPSRNGPAHRPTKTATRTPPRLTCRETTHGIRDGWMREGIRPCRRAAIRPSPSSARHETREAGSDEVLRDQLPMMRRCCIGGNDRRAAEPEQTRWSLWPASARRGRRGEGGACQPHMGVKYKYSRAIPTYQGRYRFSKPRTARMSAPAPVQCGAKQPPRARSASTLSVPLPAVARLVYDGCSATMVLASKRW